jgi:hypothetical protein
MEDPREMNGQKRRLLLLLRVRWYMATTMSIALLLLGGALYASSWDLAAGCVAILVFGTFSLARSYRQQG